MTDYTRLWQWFTSRVAVEITRLRTGWLGDAWHWFADVARGRGQGTGLHVLPAGETPFEPEPHTHASDWDADTCPICFPDEPLEPLPTQVGNYRSNYADLREHIDAAWAATGTTEREFWASRDRVDDLVAEFEATGNLPGPAQRLDSIKGDGSDERRAGEPTNVTRGYWTPRETAVDPSLAAAIRAEIDGTEHMHQYVDRLFSRINVPQIIERSFAGVSPT